MGIPWEWGWRAIPAPGNDWEGAAHLWDRVTRFGCRHHGKSRFSLGMWVLSQEKAVFHRHTVGVIPRQADFPELLWGCFPLPDLCAEGASSTTVPAGKGDSAVTSAGLSMSLGGLKRCWWLH